MSKILLIDDNQLISNMLVTTLKDHGYDVEAAFDANQGYATALTFQPDLMLIDVQLPDVIGFDLVRIVKNNAELQSVPIIMITGTAHKPEEKVRGFKLGIDDYVLKPFDSEELLQRISAVLRRSKPTTAAATQIPSTPLPPTAPVFNPAPAHISTPVSILIPGPSEPLSKPPSPKPLTAKPAIVEEPKKPMTSQKLISLVKNVIFEPQAAFEAHGPSRFVFAYWLTALGLTLLGVALTAGNPIKPVIAGLWVSGTWGLAVALTVMSCSIMGLHLTWQEGGRMVSLAGIPLIFKMISGVIVTLFTGLVPFYFTAGPAILLAHENAFLQRIDVFELWSCALLWFFIRLRAHGVTKYSWISVPLVWLMMAVMMGVLSTLIQPVNL